MSENNLGERLKRLERRLMTFAAAGGAALFFLTGIEFKGNITSPPPPEPIVIVVPQPKPNDSSFVNVDSFSRDDLKKMADMWRALAPILEHAATNQPVTASRTNK